MSKRLAHARFAAVLLFAAIVNASHITDAAEQRPDWAQAQHDATTALMQPGATLAALVEQVNAQPPADAQQALFNLNVLARAGISKRSIIVVRDLKQLDPKLEGSVISQIYYDACDHLHAWSLAQAIVEAYSDQVSEIDLDNRLIKHLLDSGWSADRIDNWLAEKPVRVNNFWVKARLRFSQQHGRGDELEKKLADAVREKPGDVAGAIAYLEIVAQAFASKPNSKPDVAFVAEIVKPRLATDASEMAEYFSRLKMFEQAAAFYRQATTIELTTEEARRLGSRSQAMFSEAAMRANFEMNVREQLAQCLLQLHKADEAQKWKAEAANIRAQAHVPDQPFFVGPNLRGVAPIAREKKLEEKPAEVAPNLAGHLQVVPAAAAAEDKAKPEEKPAEDDPRYWYGRAEKYLSSGEAAEQEKALKKGLALAKPKPEPAPMGKGMLDLRTVLLSDYANLLKRQNRNDEAVSLLRQELTDSPANSVSSARAGWLLGYEFANSLKSDDAVLWTWLENRPQWNFGEERLLWEMLKNAKKEDLDKSFARAEKLAMNIDPTRASTLGWIENRMDFAKRSLPLLEYAVKNTNDGELLGKTMFTLLESYLDSGDWKRAEDIFPDAAARLTDSELPQWYGRLAAVAAKAGAKDDAMRIWNRMANLDLTAINNLDEMAQAGLKQELIAYYRDVQEKIPASEIPAKAIAKLQSSRSAPRRAPILGGEEIFGNAAGAQLIVEARKFDPMFSQTRDRDKAAKLYEQAIDAQPGAKINAQLANRIAQMYAFNTDPDKGIGTNPELANKWWTRCLEYSNPRQVLWSDAHMGLVGVSVSGGNPQSSLDLIDEILKIDPSTIELDDWKAWPDGDSEEEKASRAKELERVQNEFKEFQGRAKKLRGELEKSAKARERRAQQRQQ